MNPFLLGLLGITGAQNPEMFSGAMSQAGISPDSMPAIMGGMGSDMPAGNDLGSYLMPQIGAGMTPGGAAPGAAPAAPMDMMKLLQGIKAPQQATPLMHAGVSGAQQAPTMKAGGAGQGSGVGQAIMNLLSSGGPQNALRVPSLGSLITGGGGGFR